MKTTTVTAAASTVLLSLGLFISGCQSEVTGDKMSAPADEKMSDGMMSDGKMGMDKMSDEKMSDGKMADEKMADEKMEKQ